MSPAEETESKSRLTEEQRKELLEHAIERRNTIAESELEMARLFLTSGKVEIARRRLAALIERFRGSGPAQTAQQMLGSLGVGDHLAAP